MGLELPPELAGVLDLFGLDWPGVDEDEMVRFADGLRGVASAIDSVQMNADKALTALREVYHGASADRLAELWETVSKYSGLVVEACGVAANALNAAALVIEGCKGATVVQLVATQGEMLASSLIGPEGSAAVVAAGRQILSTVLEEAVSALGQALAQPVADLVETVVKQLMPSGGPGPAGTVGAGFGIDLGQLASCALELRRHADDIDSHGSSFRTVVEGLDLGNPGDAFGRLVVAAAEQIATTIGVEVLERLLGSFRGTADRMDKVAQNLTDEEDSHARQIYGILAGQDSPTSSRPLRLASVAGGMAHQGMHAADPATTGGSHPEPRYADAAGLLVVGGGGAGAGGTGGQYAPGRPAGDRPLGGAGSTARSGVPSQQARTSTSSPRPDGPHGTGQAPPRTGAGVGAGHRGAERGIPDRGPAAKTPGRPGPAPYGQSGGGPHQGDPGSHGADGRARDAAAAQADDASRPSRDTLDEEPVGLPDAPP